MICLPCVNKNFLFVFFFFINLQLQEAYARGELKPGLNVELENGIQRKAINNIVSSIIVIVTTIDQYKLHQIEIFVELFCSLV